MSKLKETERAIPRYRIFAQNFSSRRAARKSPCCFFHCVQIAFRHRLIQEPFTKKVQKK